MDPLGYQHQARTTLPPLPPGSPQPDAATTATAKWPSSPVIKPNSVGGEEADEDPSVVWPHRATSPDQQQQRAAGTGQGQPVARAGMARPPNGTLQPRSPVRQDDRRVTGSLDAAGPSKARPVPGVTRLRTIGVERNRRDLFVKFDAYAVTKSERSGHFSNVSRSYREFGLLFEALAANNPHTIVPPVPFPNTSAPGQADDERLVAASFQQFFDRLLDDASLRTDDELLHFLESDFGYTPATRARRKLASSTFGFSLSRSTSHRVGLSDEEDELANARLQFRLLDEKLTEATHAIEGVSKARRSMAIAHAEASEKIAAFSTTEDHPPLAEGLRKLARSERAFGDIEANAAIGEMVTLSDGMGWCAVQSRAGKDVLKNRVSVLEDHHAAAKKSIEKRRTVERIRASSAVGERADAALEELEEAKRLEDVLARKATAIGTSLRPALRTHSKHLHDDLLYALMEHARTQTIYERQILKELELLRPEIAKIPAKDSGIVYVAQASSSAATSPAPGSSPSLSMRRGGSTMSTPYSPRPGSIDSTTRPQSMYAGSAVASPNLGAGPDDPLQGSMINTTSTVGRSHRINDMARSVLVTKGEMDRRQAVDAKSAAASLARLF